MQSYVSLELKIVLSCLILAVVQQLGFNLPVSHSQSVTLAVTAVSITLFYS